MLFAWFVLPLHVSTFLPSLLLANRWNIKALWGGFSQSGETYVPNRAFVTEVPAVVNHFKGKGKGGKDFVHYFDTTGILQHNDNGPGTWHPTDIGQLKVAAHLQQYIKLKFGWEMVSTGEFPYQFHI
jgi:hypothetical protein